jgi:DNA polymerase-3 subunit delta'
VLLLVTAAPDRLLPTLRSRCVRVAFGPLPHAFVRDEVQRRLEVTPDVAEAVASLADGSLERALDLDAERLADRRGRIERFEAVTGSDLRTVLRFADEAGSSREEAEATLALLTVWVRDVAVTRAGARACSTPSCGRSPSRWRRARRRRAPPAVPLLDDAMVAIRQRNASPRLQLERMLLEMEG